MKIRTGTSYGLSVVIAMLAAGCGNSSPQGNSHTSGTSPVTVTPPGTTPPPTTGSESGLYVSATAPAGGDGSLAKPFNSLMAVQQASMAGDTITVIAVSTDVAPLDGGIALKSNQKLVGQGNSATASPAMLARITNTSAANNSGDAVELAPGVEVSGLTIVNSYRGGIYGLDVPGVNVHDNDVSAQNTSCTVGFVIPGDLLPSNVPGVTLPFPVTLPNGWAGIMVDGDQGSGSFNIQDNTVHDSPCGDGIDVRMKGTAVYSASILRNTVFNLQQGSNFMSVLAIGVQSSDTSQLTAMLDENTEHDIGNITNNSGGNTGADSEGVFVNAVDTGTITEQVNHNNFYHGIGGFSANGMEMVLMGSGGTVSLHIQNSSFTDVPGDVLEELALGSNGMLQLELDNVTASYSNGMSGTEGGFSTIASTNVGDCLSVNSGGSGNSIQLTMKNSTFSNCIYDGVTFASNADPGSGPNELISFDIENSQITANKNYGLHVLTSTAVTQLTGKIVNTNFTGNQGINIGLTNQSGASGAVTLDFGGGVLGSGGGNCIVGGSMGAVTATGYDVSLVNNWWGAATGPALGSVVAVGGTAIDTPFLTAAPAACSSP